MALDEEIPVIAEPGIPSFPYEDIADRTGVRTFYLANTEASNSVVTNVLTQNIVYSFSAEASGATASGPTLILVSDKDYDLTTFNTPATIKGTAYINIPHIIQSASGAASSFLEVFIRKWDGTTEEEIANNVTPQVTGTAGVAVGKKIHYLPISIPTEEHFKIGETLRCTVKIYAGGAGSSWAYGTDPQDRTTGWLIATQGMDTTASTVYIPFKINL